MARSMMKPSMSSAKAVNAVELLKGQHREVEDLFETFEDMGERAFKARMQCFEKIAHKLTCHARIEEKIFYPAVREIDKTIVLESYEEHEILKTMMRKIAALESGDESFTAKMTVLKEIVEHHVKEEEEELFPKVEKSLGEDSLMELGEEMKLAFDKLDAGHPEPTPRHLTRAK